MLSSKPSQPCRCETRLLNFNEKLLLNFNSSAFCFNLVEVFLLLPTPFSARLIEVVGLGTWIIELVRSVLTAYIQGRLGLFSSSVVPVHFF